MDMLAIVVPVFAVIATGLIAVRTGLVPASIASGLVTFSYFVCVPSLMFSIVARYPLDGLLAWDFWLLFGAGSLLALFVLRYAGGRLLGPDGRTRAVSALAAVMANTGFVALPVLYAIFGEAGVPSAAIANIVIAAVLIPAGVVLLEATGGIGGGVRATPRRMALQVLKNPMVWPALLGFAFAALRLPVPQMIEDYIDLLGQGLTPLRALCHRRLGQPRDPAPRGQPNPRRLDRQARRPARTGAGLRHGAGPRSLPHGLCRHRLGLADGQHRLCPGGAVPRPGTGGGRDHLGDHLCQRPHPARLALPAGSAGTRPVRRVSFFS